MGLTLGLLLPASGLDPRGLGFLLPVQGFGPGNVSLLVIVGQDVAIADGLEVNAYVVRGDDGQRALDARMQRSSEPLAHLTAQCNQTAPNGAT